MDLRDIKVACDTEMQQTFGQGLLRDFGAINVGS